MGFQASVQTEARISSAKKFNIRAHRPDQRQLAFVKVGGDIFSFCDDEKDYDDDVIAEENRVRMMSKDYSRKPDTSELLTLDMSNKNRLEGI